MLTSADSAAVLAPQMGLQVASKASSASLLVASGAKLGQFDSHTTHCADHVGANSADRIGSRFFPLLLKGGNGTSSWLDYAHLHVFMF